MRSPANPVLVLVIALPLLAVVGSFASLALALTRGDSELPKNYHWEGGALDREQERMTRAAQLGIGATIAIDPLAQRCTVALHGAAPAALRLTLTHPTSTGADRAVTLARHGTSYSAPCPALAAAHWWLELADDQEQWLLRARLHGDLQEPSALGAAAARAVDSP